MKKVFIASGEVSGDNLGAWYLNLLKQEDLDLQCHAIGGDALEKAGANLYERIEKLNMVGVLEVIKHIRFIFSFAKELVEYILQNDFDEVILVDFPGFNLMVAKKLKKKNPNIKITYLSPPQVWAWGEWRIKKLKKYCDKLIVLYPFEVDWYKQRGIETVYLGNPVCSKLKPYLDSQNSEPENQIAILPGSRKSEIEKLLPIFADVVRRLKLAWPNIKIVLPLAESFSVGYIENRLKKNGLLRWGSDIEIVIGEQQKLKALSRCCLAITKPGTITLELALLEIPSVIVYKTSWVTYFVAKLLVKIKFMSLPNLLLNKPVYKEFIQKDCKADLIFEHVNNLYKSFLAKNNQSNNLKNQFVQLKELFL